MARIACTTAYSQCDIICINSMYVGGNLNWGEERTGYSEYILKQFFTSFIFQCLFVYAGHAKQEDAAFALAIPKLKDQNLCFTLEAEALLRGLKEATKVGKLPQAFPKHLEIYSLWCVRSILRCTLTQMIFKRISQDNYQHLRKLSLLLMKHLPSKPCSGELVNKPILYEIIYLSFQLTAC